jgi:hypothetical protein
VPRKWLRIVKTPFLNNHRSQHGDYGKPLQNVGFATGPVVKARFWLSSSLRFELLTASQ